METILLLLEERDGMVLMSSGLCAIDWTMVLFTVCNKFCIAYLLSCDRLLP